MALSHGRKLYFSVASPSTGVVTSTDLSAYTKEVNGLPGEQDLADVTVAGNVGHTSFPGLQKASFSSVHMFDDGTSASWTTLANWQTTQTTYTSTGWTVSFGPRGNSTGFPKITCLALIKQITMPIRVTDPNTFTVNWEMSAGTVGITATTWA